MPIHPKTLEIFKAKGMTTNYNLDTGAPREDSDLELQMLAGIGRQAGNHHTWHDFLRLMKDSNHEIKESVRTCKREIEQGSDKEFVLVSYDISGVHPNGTPIAEHWTSKGSYLTPVFKRVFDGRIEKWVEGDEVISSTEHFEYPFKGRETKIENLAGKMQKLGEFTDEGTRFHIISPKGIKLTTSEEDWYALPYAELVTKYSTNPANAALADLTKAILRAQEVVSETKGGIE